MVDVRGKGADLKPDVQAVPHVLQRLPLAEKGLVSAYRK